MVYIPQHLYQRPEDFLVSLSLYLSHSPLQMQYTVQKLSLNSVSRGVTSKHCWIRIHIRTEHYPAFFPAVAVPFSAFIHMHTHAHIVGTKI